MPRVRAGLLMYRIPDGELQMLLAHPGGPFFKNKDDGAWTIPKGEIEPGEDLLEAAKREFKEETGVTPIGQFIRRMSLDELPDEFLDRVGGVSVAEQPAGRDRQWREQESQRAHGSIRFLRGQ